MQQAALAAPLPPRPVWTMRPACEVGQEVQQPLDPSLPLLQCSTAFAPDANLLAILPDRILTSSDNVRFYIHSPVLLSTSSNMFGHLLSPDKHDENDENYGHIRVEMSASVLNVILHTAYYISCAPYQPSPDTLLAAIEALPEYGMSAEEHLSPSTPLYALAAAAAEHAPLDFYIAAAAQGIFPLAVAASRHLRDLNLMQVSDVHAQRMGAVYYKKLVVMLAQRGRQLRELLQTPPAPHARTPACTNANQRALREAWVLLLSDLGTNLSRYTSSQTVMARGGTLTVLLECNDCAQAVADRFQALQVQLDILDEQYMIQ